MAAVGLCMGALLHFIYFALHPPNDLPGVAAAQCRLPRAATCFNTLYLPLYSSKAVMQQRLAQACSAQLVFDEGESQRLTSKSDVINGLYQ